MIWQPIETCESKDEVLLTDGNEVYIGFSPKYDDIVKLVDFEPTHWMSLPILSLKD